MKQTKQSPQKPRRKKRRVKKSVKRGCMGIMLAAAIVVAFALYEGCNREEAPQAPALDIPPTLPPDGTDSLVAERAMRCAMTTYGIDTSRLAISIFDLTRNCPVLAHRSEALMVPASCTKLLTAIAAFRLLGTDHQYESHVLAEGTVEQGRLRGNIILQADDDPLIESLDDFAQAIRQSGITEVEGNVVLEPARRDTLRPHPTASPWDIAYSKVPVLMKGEKRIEQEFAGALRRQGITVAGGTPAAQGGRRTIHTVRHTLREVCAPMLIHSSNIKAEAVFHRLHRCMPLQYQAENVAPLTPMQRFLLEELAMFDCGRYTILDGSGLSPANRMSATFLTRLLIYAFRHDDIRQILIDEALATPGHPVRHGSLLGRMASPAFSNRVFCKTGTLTTLGVSSLAGYAQGSDGRWFAFAIISTGSPVADSRNMQDGICRAMVQTCP